MVGLICLRAVAMGSRGPMVFSGGGTRGDLCHMLACGARPTGSMRWIRSSWPHPPREGAKVGLLAELRFREKAMGTTWTARQDMRIRYIAPAENDMPPATVTSLEEYRDL
jgi:hypothetical protein